MSYEEKYIRAMEICKYHLEQGNITFLVASDMFREMWDGKLESPYKEYRKRDGDKVKPK